MRQLLRRDMPEAVRILMQKLKAKQVLGYGAYAKPQI